MAWHLGNAAAPAGEFAKRTNLGPIPLGDQKGNRPVGSALGKRTHAAMKTPKPSFQGSAPGNSSPGSSSKPGNPNFYDTSSAGTAQHKQPNLDINCKWCWYGDGCKWKDLHCPFLQPVQHQVQKRTTAPWGGRGKSQQKGWKLQSEVKLKVSSKGRWTISKEGRGAGDPRLLMQMFCGVNQKRKNGNHTVG